MKKLVLMASVVMGLAMVSTAHAGSVKVSTTAFTVSHSTIGGATPKVIMAVNFSTGSVFDFVDIIDSSATVVSGGAPTFRFYNDNVTSTATVSTLGSGKSKSHGPIPLYRGGLAKPSAATYNRITIIYEDVKP